MTEIEVQDIITLAKNLWEKSKSEELAILKGMLKPLAFHEAKRILESSRVAANVSMLPLKTIKDKLDANPQVQDKLAKKGYRYHDCYIVCVDSDGSNRWMRAGAFRELAIPHHYDVSELQGLLSRYVEREFVPVYGLARYEFFVGNENLGRARMRARELEESVR